MAIPLVSVIIPTYNRLVYIKRAIKSILNQTFKEFEIIVVDDASTDNTADYIRRIQKDHKNIHYQNMPSNMGAQAARNVGIKVAKGEWIAFLDSDDEWLPDRLKAGLDLQKKTGVEVVHSECYITDGNASTPRIMGLPRLSGYIYKLLLQSPGPMFQGLLARRKCFDRIDYLDESIVSYQEWDTAIRLSKYYQFGFVPDPMFIYHCHDGETISKDMNRDEMGYEQVVEKHKMDIKHYLGENTLMKHYQILTKKRNHD